MSLRIEDFDLPLTREGPETSEVVGEEIPKG